MNIEYKRMPDDTIFVTDELGHITQRNNHTSRDELLLENKIEVIDKNILDANKELDNLKGVIRLDKAIVLAFSIAVIPALIQAIYLKIVPNLACCVVTLFDLIFIIMDVICRREKISLESKIAKAQELRKEYEKELEKIKSLNLKENLMINHTVDLTAQNEMEISKINNSLKEAYYNVSPSRNKKLVLKKRN